MRGIQNVLDGTNGIGGVTGTHQGDRIGNAVSFDNRYTTTLGLSTAVTRAWFVDGYAQGVSCGLKVIQCRVSSFCTIA